jgi:hypothetical protein
MKYLSRLKNELQELTNKLSVKGRFPEYVSLRRVNRKDVITALIVLLKQVRAADHACDDWSPENSGAWMVYLTNLRHWISQAPELSKKVEKTKSAA